MSKKPRNAQERLDEIKSKNADRAKKFKAKKEAEGLVRVSVWISSKMKQHIDKNGYHFVVGFFDVETGQVPYCVDGKWQIKS